MSNYFLFSGGHTEIDAEGDGIDATGGILQQVLQAWR